MPKSVNKTFSGTFTGAGAVHFNLPDHIKIHKIYLLTTTGYIYGSIHDRDLLNATMDTKEENVAKGNFPLYCNVSANTLYQAPQEISFEAVRQQISLVASAAMTWALYMEFEYLGGH